MLPVSETETEVGADVIGHPGAPMSGCDIGSAPAMAALRVSRLRPLRPGSDGAGADNISQTLSNQRFRELQHRHLG